MPGDWKRSQWDDRVHYFAPYNEVISEAPCDHSAVTDHLVTPEAGDRYCQVCMLLHGDTLADAHGQTLWRMNE